MIFKDDHIVIKTRYGMYIIDYPQYYKAIRYGT